MLKPKELNCAYFSWKDFGPTNFLIIIYSTYYYVQFFKKKKKENQSI